MRQPVFTDRNRHVITHRVCDPSDLGQLLTRPGPGFGTETRLLESEKAYALCVVGPGRPVAGRHDGSATSNSAPGVGGPSRWLADPLGRGNEQGHESDRLLHSDYRR